MKGKYNPYYNLTKISATMYPLKKLSEICEIVIGGTPSRWQKSYWNNGEFLWVSIADMTSSGKFISQTKEKITEAGVKNSNVKLIPKWNLIFSFKLSIGKLAFVEQDLYTNEAIAGLIIKNEKELSREYLYYFMSQATFSDTTAAVKGKTLNKEKMKEIQIPLPPLSTQLDIVAHLDSAMAEIDSLRTETESALASTRELWESTLESVFASEGNDWNNTKLQNHIELILGFAFKSKNYSESEDDILLLRGDNIMQWYIRYEDIKRWKRAEYNEYRKYQLQENDILLAMDRPWTKAWLKCAKLWKEYLPALLVQRTACLRNKEDLDNTFLYYIVKSRRFLSHLLWVQTGIGVPHISWSQILDFSFQIPPLPEQSRIVAHLDAVRAEMEQLEWFYSEKLASLDELKRSVLQEAFS